MITMVVMVMVLITMVVMVMMMTMMVMMMPMMCSSVVLRIRVDVASRGLFGDQVYSATELTLEFFKYLTNNFLAMLFKFLHFKALLVTE